MFDLGMKQIVINGNALVTEVGTTTGVSGVISIKGFGKFTIPEVAPAAARNGAVTAASNAALGVYTVVVGGYSSTKKYNVIVTVEAVRATSELTQSHGGDQFVFQTGAGANFGVAAAAGQIAGFNDTKIKFSGTTDIIMTFQPGYEGVKIKTVTILEAATETAVPVTSITANTTPSYGVGLGKIIEEEVQNATGGNTDPYGLGGKDIVDIRGKYTEILWEAVAEDDDSPGWEPHASSGAGDVNTTAAYAPRQFVAYVNEASAAATVTLLTKLVNGEAQAS
jgi:hypothetical protein